MISTTNTEAVYAHARVVSTPMSSYYLALKVRQFTQHWSRGFEYSWVLANGGFQKGGKVVMDAGGGGMSPLAKEIASYGNLVLAADLDDSQIAPAASVIPVKMDLRCLPIVKDTVPSITCVSVLEHVDDPLQVVKELYRVLAKAGRLLITMDVADYARWNHTIDEAKATEILDYLGIKMPVVPEDVLTANFPEIDPGEGEPQSVNLRVLCVRCDKPWR